MSCEKLNSFSFGAGRLRLQAFMSSDIDNNIKMCIFYTRLNIFGNENVCLYLLILKFKKYFSLISNKYLVLDNPTGSTFTLFSFEGEGDLDENYVI